MRTVGIKLADGSFYPIMEEGSAQKKTLELTTAHDNQTCVMVDLYRSKLCSMEDAEYIDTLKIENLNAHQNGEPSISFDVGLDENGELSASIADPETGATSNSQITLVSRTAEERLVADDYSISGDEPVKEKSGNGAGVAAGVVAGAGLLAAAGMIAANKNKENEDIVTDDDIAEVTEEAGLDDFSYKDAPYVDIPQEKTTEDITSESPLDIADSNNFIEDTSDDTLPDMDFDMSEDTTETAEEPTDTFDVPEDTTETFDTPDDITETTEPVEENFDIPEDTTEVAEPTAEETFDIPEDTTEATEPTEEDFDIPEDTTEATEPTEEDFDIPEDTNDTSDNFNLPDDTTIPGDETFLEDESFGTPQALTDSSEEDADTFFNNLDSEPAADSSENLNFTGLYDKETEMGDSAVHEEDDIKKKTRTPVIICIICAIICIVATVLVLLVVPGKFNLRQKHADKKSQTTVEKQVETPVEAPAPVEEKKPDPVPQAKEDEVVVIEKAEEVKPLPPPAAETKNKNVTYKIKWGDTLWDIADTYYKNPWRYKKIANYNGIKNPDHIISGTIITIPAE